MEMKKHSDFFLKVDNYFENLQLKLQEKILSIEKNFTKSSKKTAPDETNSLRLAHPILDKHGKHQQFCVDEWQKPKNEKTYGKGKTTILEQGIVFEKAGIGFSNVFGHSLPNPHRNETRGIGGIFFDDFCTGNPNEDFSLIKSIGESFIPAYFPIIENRHSMAYGIKERSFQAYRRGRYVEFNLLYDRGTHFGLQTGWRTESYYYRCHQSLRGNMIGNQSLEVQRKTFI